MCVFKVNKDTFKTLVDERVNKSKAFENLEDENKNLVMERDILRLEVLQLKSKIEDGQNLAAFGMLKNFLCF